MSNEEKKTPQKERSGESIDVVQALLQNEDPSDTTEFLKNRISNELTEEQLLWLDVMTVALWDYKDNLNAKDASGSNLFNEVFDWAFNKQEDSTYLGTFENICIHLDINPSVLRSRLIKYTKQYHSEVPETRPSIVINTVTMIYTNSIYIDKNSILPEDVNE